MRKRFITIIATMIIPTVLGLIQLYDWLIKPSAHVTVFVEVHKSQFSQPAPTRELLNLITVLKSHEPDSSQDPPDCITVVADAIRKEHSNPIMDDRGVDLLVEGAKILTPDNPQQPKVTYEDFYILRVVNSGSVPAKDFSISLPDAAFFEVWAEGYRTAVEQVGRTEGEIRIPLIQPDNTKFIYLWLDTELFSDDYAPTASYEGGRVAFEDGTVLRTGYNYVLNVPRKHFVYATITVCVLLFLVIMVWTRRTARRENV